jgi:hypothetical protein
MKRLLIPQQEFAFVAQTVGSIRETATDGERLARMRDEADRAASEAKQPRLSVKPRKPKTRLAKAKRHAHQHT